MATAVVCPQCGKRYLLPEGYAGRAVCPYCRKAGAAALPAERVAAPVLPPPAVQAAPRPGPAGPREEVALSATARAAREAWRKTPRRRARRWPPPRDERSATLAEALRRRANWHHGLVPYLILLGVLAAVLAVFAILAARHRGASLEPASARSEPTTGVTPYV